MFQLHDSIESVARDLGVSPVLLQSKRFDHLLKSKDPKRLDAAVTKIAAAARKDAVQYAGMTDVKQVKDAATAFVTSALSEVLAPVEMPGRENYLFVPGRTGDGGPLLPVVNRVPLGKQQVEWPVIAHTGEARAIAPGGLKNLTRVDSSDDMRKQPVFFYGISFDWDQFELWQASHLGRDIPSERQRGARNAMDEFAEDVYGFGHDEREVPGFFTAGGVTSITLSKSFGDTSITMTEILTQLSIMDIAWGAYNPRRPVTGVVMPKSHRLNMMTKFTGTTNEGDVNAWKFAVEMFPWLNNIIEDQRMLTANDDSGPMWQMFSADGEELYNEGTPSPMVYGPFESEMSLKFIAIAQTGGCVSKNPRRVMRWIQPS